MKVELMGFILRPRSVAHDEAELAMTCAALEESLGEEWNAISTGLLKNLVFDLLKFEEYLMILIMVPIGLVAAFAIAVNNNDNGIEEKFVKFGLLVCNGRCPVFLLQELSFVCKDYNWCPWCCLLVMDWR